MIKRSLLLLGLIFLIPYTAFATDVISDGYGLNRQEAVKDAYRAAVEKVVIMNLHPKIMLNNLELLYTDIFQQAEKSFKGYDILREDKKAGIVVVTAKVSLDLLPNSLLMKLINQQKLMNKDKTAANIGIVVSQKHGSFETLDHSVATKIVDRLQETGFTQAIETDSASRNSRKQLSKAIKLNDLNRLIKDYSAQSLDYLIAAAIVCEKTGKTGEVTNVEANMLIKIINMNKKEIIAFNKYKITDADITEKAAVIKAFNAAGQQAGSFASELISKDEIKPLKSIQFVIKDIQVAKLLDLLKRLENNETISKAFIRSTGGKLVVIDVYCNGTAQEIADMINKMPKLGIELEYINYNLIIGKV